MAHRADIFRVSASETGLAVDTFAAWGIPLPTVVDWRDHSTSRTRSDGSQMRVGFRQLNLTWDILTALQWNTLLDIVRDVGPSQIYVTVDVQNGNKPGEFYVDLSGFPHRPTSVQHGESVVGRRGGAYSFINITLFINNVTVLANPSLYSPDQ